MRYISLDTETTGLNVDLGHKLIEIGCIEIIDRTLTGNKFHKFINPNREIELSATKIHGMRWDDLKKYPLFKDVAVEFCEFVKGAILIIHNAKFDLGFLNAELSFCGKPNLESYTDKVIDSLSLARVLHPGKKNSLDILCSRYKIDNSERTLHGALLDSDLLAKVYLAMTRGQENLNIQDRPNQNFKVLSKEDTNYRKVQTNMASEEENNCHQEYLQRMEKDCEAKVLWLSK